MFQETPEGSTHHHKDACYKCGICGDHFFTEDKAKNCNHDYSIARNLINKPIPPNAQRIGDEGRVEKKENNWEEELWVEVMEDYTITAELGHFAKDQKDHKNEMRVHFSKLKSFISTQIEKARIEARKDLLAQLDEK